MSSEMRELIAKWRETADQCEERGLEACSIGLTVAANKADARADELRGCANELEALLARTEAGADGADRAVAWRDEDFVLMPRSLSAASAERMAHFDFDDVGNSYGDAVDELWGELIKTEAREIPLLEFSNPVFHAGNNTTVRRGTKWYGREYARVAIGGETVIVRLSAVTQRFCYLTDHWLRDEHDPSCRTVAGLLAEMKRVYPGFSDREEVTVLNFTLPAYTHPQDASGDAEDAARWRHVRKDGLIWRVNMLALAKDDIDILFGAKADAAIDAAMQAKEAK